MSQLVGSVTGVAIGGVFGFVIYGILKKTMGIRLSEEEEFIGADLAIHKVSAYPEEDFGH